MNSEKIVKNYLYDVAYQVLLLFTPLITTPYISRVLGPTNLGIYGYVASISTYFILFGTMGTALYARREIAFFQDDEEKRTKIFWEIITIRTTLILISAFIYVFLFCNSKEYTLIYRLFLIDIIANLFDVSWFFQGLQDFKKTVVRNAVVKVCGIVLVFLFVKTSEQLYLYTLCLTVPTLLGHLSLWVYLKEYLKKHTEKITIVKHFVPILTLFIPQVAVEIYTVLDKTMIGNLCADIAEVGYYTQAQKIIQIALKLVTSIGVVVMPAMALEFQKGKMDEVRKAVDNSFRFMSLIGVPAVFGLMATAGKMVPWFFGNGYELVINLIVFSAPIIIAISYSTVIGSQFLLATKRQGIYTASVFSGSVANLICNYVLIPRFGATGATVASVIAECVVSAVQLWFSRNEVNILKNTLSCWKFYLSGSLMAIVVYYTGNNMAATPATSIIQIIVGIIAYCVLLFVLRDKTFRFGVMAIHDKLLQKR